MADAMIVDVVEIVDGSKMFVTTVGVADELELRRVVAVRGYVRRCQVSAKSIAAFTILTFVQEDGSNE